MPLRMLCLLLLPCALIFGPRMSRTDGGFTHAAQGESAYLIALIDSALQEARVSLQNGRIVWSRTTFQDGLLSQTLETTGRYELFFDGDRMAVSAADDRITEEPRGNSVVELNARTTERWDGNLFYIAPGDVDQFEEMAIMPEPEFRTDHDLLGLIFRTRIGDITRFDIHGFVPDPPEGAVRSVSASDWEGRDAVHVTYETGDARTESWHDVERGGYLVAEDWYRADSHVYEYRAVVQLVDGVWFPTFVMKTSFDETGQVTLQNVIDVDLQRTSFNRGLVLPQDFFTLRPHKGVEVSDYRFGLRMNYIFGEDVGGVDQVRALVARVRAMLQPN